MNLLGALILLLLVFVVFAAQRRWALMAMMAGVLFLTEAQQIDVVGFNLFAMRFLELAGFIRVMGRHEFSFQKLNKVDHALLLLYLFVPIIYALRGDSGQAYVIGSTVDAFLCYFTFRGLMQEMNDLRWFLRTLVFLLAPYMVLVVMESKTGHNSFDVLGGFQGGSQWMRHDRPRCFGSFRQPDTLGMFAASFVPLYIGMVCLARERLRAILGIALCLIIVWASNAGGPSSALAAGILGWGLWRFRTAMRKVRWTIVAMISALALMMKAPVWYIFARISDITGGDGWHRSYLIDVSYRHLGQWWLVGMDYMNTQDWFPYSLAVTGAADITNQYIGYGLSAGFGAVALFILLLTRAFSNLGKALAAIRASSQSTDDNELLLWGLGAMLGLHIIDWFGITYFDQMYVVWYLQLAAISTFSEKFIPPESVTLKNEDCKPAAVENVNVSTVEAGGAA